MSATQNPNLSNCRYVPRIYEPVVVTHATIDNLNLGLKHTASATVTGSTPPDDRYSYALLSQIQRKAVDYIYNQIHDLCVTREIRVSDGVPSPLQPPNTFMFGDAALVHPRLKYRPILASDQRPLFTNSLVFMEYSGQRLGTLTYSEDKQITTKSPKGETTESINFYLAFKLGTIKNITILRSK